MQDRWNDYLSDKTDEKRNALCDYYWPFAISTARRYLKQRGCEYRLDEVSSYVAQRVLTTTIPDFDPEVGISFECRLVRDVKLGVLDALRAIDELTRSQRRNYKMVRVARDKLTQQLCHLATDFEVAEYLGKTEQEVVAMDCCISVPLDHPVLSPEEYSEEAFNNIISRVEEKNQSLMRMYYLEGKTQKEIATELGMTQAAVSYRLKSSRKKC